jgi:hypothetical protein
MRLPKPPWAAFKPPLTKDPQANLLSLPGSKIAPIELLHSITATARAKVGLGPGKEATAAPRARPLHPPGEATNLAERATAKVIVVGAVSAVDVDVGEVKIEVEEVLAVAGEAVSRTRLLMVRLIRSQRTPNPTRPDLLQQLLVRVRRLNVRPACAQVRLCLSRSKAEEVQVSPRGKCTGRVHYGSLRRH